MHQNITRRSVAKGAAWSVPVIAATSDVPTMAASTPTPEGCALTDDQLNNGYCGTRVADSWAIEGSRTFGNQFGGAANAQTSLNIGFRSTCNYRGSVTFKLKNGVRGEDPSVAHAHAERRAQLFGRRHAGQRRIGRSPCRFPHGVHDPVARFRGHHESSEPPGLGRCDRQGPHRDLVHRPQRHPASLPADVHLHHAGLLECQRQPGHGQPSLGVRGATRLGRHRRRNTRTAPADRTHVSTGPSRLRPEPRDDGVKQGLDGVRPLGDIGEVPTSQGAAELVGTQVIGG
jgi:hypothetical protein